MPAYTRIRGQSLERYIEEQSANKLERLPELPDEQSADFKWSGRRASVFVESKFCLLPNGDRQLSNARSVGVAWGRAFEAVEQLVSSAGRDEGSFRRVGVIVSNEILGEEFLRFSPLLKESRVLSSTRLKAICLMSVDEFLDWVSLSDADCLADAIVGRWQGYGDSADLVEWPELVIPGRPDKRARSRLAMAKLWPDLTSVLNQV